MSDKYGLHKNTYHNDCILYRREFETLYKYDNATQVITIPNKG